VELLGNQRTRGQAPSADVPNDKPQVREQRRALPSPTTVPCEQHEISDHTKGTSRCCTLPIEGRAGVELKPLTSSEPGQSCREKAHATSVDADGKTRGRQRDKYHTKGTPRCRAPPTEGKACVRKTPPGAKRNPISRRIEPVGLRNLLGGVRRKWCGA